MKLSLSLSLAALAALPSGGGGAPGSYIQPIIMVGASNTAGGDDSGGAALSSADDLAAARWLDPATGDIMALDYTQGIPRPGGLSTQSTTPAIEFTRYLSNNNGGADIIYVIGAFAVGGRGVFIGGTTSEQGPWHPEGAGPAWDIGGDAAASVNSGAMYLAHTSGNLKSAFDAAVASEFPDRTVLPPIFFGHPLNENDAASTSGFDDFLSVGATCMTGIRSAWGAADAPWVIYGGPPEWTYAGSLGRERVVAANAYLAQALPNVAFVEGQEGNQHPDEAIHFSNAGYRLLGAKCGPAVAVAQERGTAPKAWFDWIDALTNKPARFYGLYRGLASYGTGSCIEISNGTTTTDIAFLASGLPDFAAILAHAGSGNAWITKVYDQMGSGATMVPEGTGQALIVSSGAILFQGRRFAWGADSNNIMLSDSSFALTAAGALLAVGRINGAGSPVMAAGPQGTLGIFASSGATAYDRGNGTRYFLNPSLEYEPSFIAALPGSPGGYNLFAEYAEAKPSPESPDGGLYVNGVQGAEGASTSFTYGTTGVLSWGGRSGATNRYSVGSHVALAAWATAPTGADKAAVLAWCAAISAVDDL